MSVTGELGARPAPTPASTLAEEVARNVTRRKWRALAVPVLLLVYFVYTFFAFDMASVIGHARPDRAGTLLRDVWSYKTEVTRRNREDTLKVAIEGERNGTYPDSAPPTWVQRDGETTRIALPGGAKVTYLPESRALLQIPDFGTVHVALKGRHVDLRLPEGKAMPSWISASHTRVSIDRYDWRFSMTRNETRTFRYFAGWELFFFTLDSPFHGKSVSQLVSLALSSKQVVPGKSNLAAMAQDFWHNKMWHHDMVAGAMLETVLMAFLGTMGGALIALPLAFMAARNFMPVRVLRFTLRRVFDFLRGVDGLIWTIILSRAFGPGPLTGSLAILLTDTGSFGKIFSEALENTDAKQVEGIRSTGANAVQRYRFGVIPQIVPVLASQVLYFLESNTRSATIIGAIVGGGIGLLLTQAIITGKDWEEVTYYIILILIMVMLMDWISGILRRRLIKGS